MRSRLGGRSLGRFARGPVASATSQATGVLQLGLLLLHGGATRATDAYFYLFGLGLTPVLILVVGVMYPLLLSDSIAQPGLRRIRIAAPLTASLFVAFGFAWFASQRGPGGALPAIASLLAVNAVLQGLLYCRAVVAEANGDPLWISGIALPANAAACAVLTLPWHSSPAATVAMSAALVIGNAACLLVMSRRRIGQPQLCRSSRDGPRQFGSAWYLARSSVSYVGQNVLTSLAVLLPASGVTVLSIAGKVVGAVSSTLVNAVMPILVHRSTESPADARRFLRLLALALGGLGALALAVVAVFWPRYLASATVIVLWTVSAAAASVAQRVAYRFLSARTVGATMLAAIGIVALTAGASRVPGFDVLVLLCAYAALDAATGAFLLWKLRDLTASALLMGALVVFGGLAISSLI